MTTERMEAFCLEEGDQIVIGEDVYRIYDIHDADGDYLFYIVDEEGIRHKVRTTPQTKLPVVIDNLAEV